MTRSIIDRGTSANVSTVSDLKDRAVFDVNMKLLFSFGCACIAYWLWPTSLVWWGFAFISFVFGFASVALLVEAIKIMRRLRQLLNLIRAYEDNGIAPKGTRLAEDDDLLRAGMLDPEASPEKAKASWFTRLWRRGPS